MLKEPTIHQIEELLRAFREQGGSDAEINAIAQDIIRDYRPEVIRPIEEVFSSRNHQSIKKIVDFKNDGKKPIPQAISNIWSHWYVKYPIIFISIFMIIFATTNLPLYIEKSKKLNYKKETITTTANNTEEEKVATSASLEPGEVIPNTPTLVVPKISVTAPIIFVDSTVEANIQEGLHNGVVHYFQTAMPGKVGNVFITGHSSNYWWDKGSYNYVFANLDKLVIGDQAKIYYNGNKYLYQVTNIKVVEPTDMSVLDQTIKPTLTLMTCTPSGTSLRRLIVTFDQISPVYKSNLVKKSHTDQNKKTTITNTLPKSDSNIFIDWIVSLFNKGL